MTPGKAIVAAVCCVVLVLVVVWLQRAEKTEARERAMAQPPKPMRPPTRFEFARALDQAEMPAIEQLELSQDERDALVEGLYEWIGELDVQTDLRADPAPREQP